MSQKYQYMNQRMLRDKRILMIGSNKKDKYTINRFIMSWRLSRMIKIPIKEEALMNINKQDKHNWIQEYKDKRIWKVKDWRIETCIKSN